MEALLQNYNKCMKWEENDSGFVNGLAAFVIIFQLKLETIYFFIVVFSYLWV